MAQDRIYKDDTAVIDASIKAADGISFENVSEVAWELLTPDNVPLIVSNVPSAPTVNQRVILSQDQTIDGNPVPQWGVLSYNGGWTFTGDTGDSFITDNNTGTLVIPASANYKAGLYRGRAQFTLSEDGSRRSTPIQFESINLVETPNDILLDPAGFVVDRTWLKLNNLFDSELGGPYVRDKTLSEFGKPEMRLLLDDTMYNINMSFQPPTGFSTTNFPFTTDWQLASQALLVDTIYHLMRSYVEQALPANSPVPYLDRRDYLQRWEQVLVHEEQKLVGWLENFKNDQLHYGEGALLIGGYASPLLRSSRVWRTRNARYNVGGYRSF